MKIAFYDSGMGGLSVLHLAMKLLPNEQFLYYADTDNVPYGTKTKDEISSFADNAVSFMAEKNVKAIVIACNTATSVAAEYLRKKYTLPIIGMEPAVKPALLSEKSKRVLVCATPITVYGEKLKNLLDEIDGTDYCDLLPLPKLVSFAENMDFDSEKVYEYLKKELSPYNLSEYSHLVLGCTHFDYFKNAFSKLLPSGIEFVSGSKGTVTHLKNILSQLDKLEHNKQTVEYYFSGRAVDDEATLKKISDYHKKLDEVYLINTTI